VGEAENWDELAFALLKIKEYGETIKAGKRTIRLATPVRSSVYKKAARTDQRRERRQEIGQLGQ
jgi:hypothetical protein